MKTCPICQKSFSDGEMFCPECGEKLINPSAPPSETPALTLTPEPAEPVKEAEAPVPPPAEESAAAETPAEPEPEDRPEPGPAEPPPPEKPPRGKRPVGVWRRILAVLLCVPLLLLLLAPTLGFEVRRTATEEGLRAALEDTSIAALPAAQLFDDVDDPTLSFSEAFTEDLAADGLKMGESTVAKIVNSSAFKSWLSLQAAAVCADVFRGRTTHEFDPETLKTELLAGKTARVLEKERVSLDDNDRDIFVGVLMRYGLGDMLSRDTLKDEMPGLVRVMHLALGYPALIALLVLALGLMLLIFKTNRWHASPSLRDIGGTALIAGLLLTLAGLLAQLLPKLWTLICGGQAIVAAASRGVLYHNLLISLGLLGVGLLLAVIGRLLRGKKPTPEPESEE